MTADSETASFDPKELLANLTHRPGAYQMLDASGRVRITGRAKLQFDVGGLKVNPEDVERALGGTPGVREVAVVPVDLTETVTRVMAVVVPEDDRDRTGLEKMRTGPASTTRTGKNRKPRPDRTGKK